MIEDIVFEILTLVLVGLLAFLAWFGAVLILKNTAPNRKDFWFIYHGIPRHVKAPNLQKSRYWNQFPAGREHWEWRATLDCEAMNELAGELNKRFEGKSDSYKAGYILAMVQQNMTYMSDRDLYGASDKFAFPVCSAYLHKGDCEDSALLGVCLSKLCGLDVAVFYVWGHLAYGVNLGKDNRGSGLSFQGKRYSWCESTGIMPVGFGNDKKQVIDIFYPEPPSKDYIIKYTVQESFEQYK